MRRHFGLIALAILLMSLEGGMVGALSYMIKPVFDEVLVDANTSAIGWIAGAVMGVFVIRALSGFAHKAIMTWVGQNIVARLQRDLVAHMLTLDSPFFQRNSPGTLIEMVRGDTSAASSIWGGVVAVIVRDTVSLISLLVVALSIDWKLTLIAVIGAPLLILPLGLLQRLVRQTSRNARRAAARLSTRLDEIFHGTDTIKLAGTEEREADRYRHEVRAFVAAQVRAAMGRSAIPAVMDVVAGIGFMGVFLYGGRQIMSGELTVGSFMSFFAAMALIFEPLRRLGGVSGAWQASLASFERVYTAFSERPSITSPAQPRKLDVPPEEADIVLDKVEFDYGDHPVLRSASFTAKAGQTTALVGASGAGKSTIFRLLTRLADPTSGRITIGGTPVDTLSLEDLRGLFSVVTQEALMFDETIRDNVLMGADASEEEIERAVEAAHVTDFLPRLSDGLFTPAGPRGSALSGGQRQRVAIARALLRDRPILLLDEATSALDAQSEAIVQAALERLSEGRTTLVIAHRLATIRNADRIVVMDQGRVLDQGTHDELLERGGVYADLYRLQFAGSGEA